MSPASWAQGIFSLTVTLRDRAIGNQHGELGKLEVRVEAKRDICPWPWLGNIDGSLDASSGSPLLENHQPSRVRPDDWAELSVRSAGADTAFGGSSGNEFSFSSCVLRSTNILTRF